MNLRTLLAATTLAIIPTAVFAQVYVQPYVRNDGTYVRPHYRSAPDSSYNNNWSVSPNSNPYTGQMGTRSPTYNDRPPSSGLGGGLYGQPLGGWNYR